MDGSSAPPSSSDRTAMPENAKESAGADEDMLEEKRSPGKPDDEPLSQEKVAAEGSIQLPKFLGSVVRAASSTAQQAATGCGCAANGPPENAANDITISITPTTGGQFDLTVDRSESVENLKKSISRKLKVAKERICLLHRERLLRDGTLEENRLQDGSRLTLLPSVETGLLTQRPEQSVMQALESLNDSQVNDFLSGKAPLNLTMRLGDHMMLIQLQLSTVTPTSPTSPTPSQSSSSNTDLNIGVNPSTGTNMPSALSNLLQSRRFERAARSSSSTSKIQSGSSRTASMISSLVSAIHATANCSTSLSTATTTTSPVCSSRATTASSVSSSSYSQIGSGFCNGQAQQSTRPGHTCSSASSPSSASSSSSSSSPSPPSATGNFACQSCLLFHLPSHHHHSYNHHHHHHHSRNKAAGAAGAAPAAGAAEAAGAAALAAAVLASCMPGNCNNPAATSSPGSTSADQQPQSTSEAPLDAPPTKKKLWTVHHHHHHSRNKGAGAAALAAAVVASCMPGNNNNPAATSSPGTTNADHQPQSTSEAPLDAPPAKKKLCTFQNHYQHWKNKRAAATALAAAVVASSSTSGSSNSPAATSSPGSTNADHQPQSTSEAPVDAPPPKRKLCTVHHHQSNGTEGSRSTSAEEARPQSPGASSSMEQSSKTASLDTRALVEASRNLTQKLKQLSSEENVRRRHGAIIESMHHHGKGVYSGTFSGTLKPALQDRHGRPKRDISTIIHILNDLLCATPAANVGHYRHHHRHSSSRQHSLTSSTATSTTGSSANLGCHDSNGSGYSTEELSKENEATKGKMRRLRLVMEQRRAQRRARQARQARAAPYTTQWAAVTPDPDPNHDPNTSATSATSATANPAEAQTEPELQPCSPKPVVA